MMNDETKNWAELLLARRREAGGDQTRECHAYKEGELRTHLCHLWIHYTGAHSWARGWHE